MKIPSKLVKYTFCVIKWINSENMTSNSFVGRGKTMIITIILVTLKQSCCIQIVTKGSCSRHTKAPFQHIFYPTKLNIYGALGSGNIGTPCNYSRCNSITCPVFAYRFLRFRAQWTGLAWWMHAGVSQTDETVSHSDKLWPVCDLTPWS